MTHYLLAKLAMSFFFYSWGGGAGTSPGIDNTVTVFLSYRSDNTNHNQWLLFPGVI